MMERRLKEDSGIFKTYEYRTNGIDDIRQFLPVFATSNQIDNVLERMETAALDVIRRHGHEYPFVNQFSARSRQLLEAGDLAGVLSLNKEINAIHATLSPEFKDAEKVLDNLPTIRDCIRENKAELAALYALQAGRLFERMKVRPFEADVRDRKKSKAGLRDANKKRFGEAGTVCKNTLKVVAHLRKKHPRLKLIAIYQKAADQLGVNLRTVQRHIKKSDDNL